MKRVLVVDDEPSAAELTIRYLRPRGFDVEAVYSGLEAVERIRSTTFDLVISDVRMPNGTGIDVWRELQRLPKKVPLILMSADTTGAKAQAKALGADAFIGKPLDRDALLNAVERLTFSLTRMDEAAP